MRRVTTALFAGLAGCTFGSAGDPGPAKPADTDGDASTGAVEADDDAPVASQSDGDGDGDGDGTSAGSSSGPGPADSTSDGDPPVAGEGALEISGGPLLELGELPVGAAHAFEVTLDNVGDGPATAIFGPELPPSFVYVGGAYPGDGGTCGVALDAAQSCTMALEVTPDRPGIATATIQVSYVGAQMAKVVDGELRLVGTGATGNLLLNPGAEAGPVGQLPPDWSVSSGDGWEATSGEVDSGAQSFWAGGSNTSGDAVLAQTVDVVGLAATIDTLGMSVSFSGRARTMSFADDPHDLRVVYLDAAEAELGAWDAGFHDETGWHTHAMTQPIPADTRRIRVELLCNKDLGSNCSAWFDTLELTASYPAQ